MHLILMILIASVIALMQKFTSETAYLEIEDRMGRCVLGRPCIDWRCRKEEVFLGDFYAELLLLQV